MDEFGVLVRQLGIKPQGKSAPMSASKEPFKTHNSDTTPNLYAGFDSTPLPNPSNSTGNSHSVSSKSLLDDQSNLFLSKSDRGPWSYGGSGGYDDVFQSSLKNPDFADSTSGADSGLGFNLESRFDGSMNLKLKSSFSTAKGGATIGDDIDDTFSGFLSTPSDPTNKVNDLLSSVDPVDDFFGNLGKMWPGSMASGGNSLDETNKNELEGDDLIPGFGRMTAMNNRERAQASSAAEDLGVSSIDELENFAMGRIWKNANGHLDVEAKVGNTATGASSTVEEALYGVDSKMTKTTKHRPWETDFILIDENSDNGSVREPKEIKAGKKTFEVESPENGIQPAPQANQRHGEVDLDSFFSVHGENNTASMPDKTNRSSIKSEVVPDLFSGTSSSTETDFSGKSITDDLFSSFGAGPPSREAEEFEEENEGRRRARFGRYQRTQARVAQALTDMNEREWQAQQEQEERRRIADTMDAEMKRWAAGKEGNLRALLSSLQQVLWPECAWRPVSLTDLITPSQVKIAYMKAALCVHPDKVQQKGASLHQKYVAEKVFDLLKEAWKKFKSEELR